MCESFLANHGFVGQQYKSKEMLTTAKVLLQIAFFIQNAKFSPADAFPYTVCYIQVTPLWQFQKQICHRQVEDLLQICNRLAFLYGNCHILTLEGL